jgi:hypothetical protein
MISSPTLALMGAPHGIEFERPVTVIRRPRKTSPPAIQLQLPPFLVG